MDPINWPQVTKFGVPAVIALYLVWRLANGFDLMAQQFEVRAQEHQTMLVGMRSLGDRSEQGNTAQQQILFVLQTMCANQAKTDGQREKCLERTH